MHDLKFLTGSNAITDSNLGEKEGAVDVDSQLNVNNGNEDSCKHRWTRINKTYRTKYEWSIVDKCRRCNVIYETNYRIVDIDGRMTTLADSRPVFLTDHSKVGSPDDTHDKSV